VRSWIDHCKSGCVARLASFVIMIGACDAAGASWIVGRDGLMPA
jgi:hypothetical protein